MAKKVKKRKTKQNVMRLEIWTLISFLSALLIIGILAWLSPKIGRWAVIKDTDKVVLRVQAAIEQEKSYVYEQAKEIATSGILDNCDSLTDAGVAEEKVIEEKRNRNISTVVVVCPNGLTLARRNPGQSSSGDYALLTTQYGRLTGEGKAVSAVAEPNSFPIAIVGTYPVFDNGQFQGAVFTGQRLDDQFADLVKARYLSANTELLFYSKKAGVTGHTETSMESDDIIHSYFSYGSDWVQDDRDNELAIMSTNNQEIFFYLKNLHFTGIDNALPGGAIIFVRYNFYLIALFVAAFTAFLYYIVSMAIHRKYKRDWEPIHMISAIIIFAYCLIISQYGLERSSTQLFKQEQTIYNSVLNIVPESGVIDLMHSQKIDIALSSGGEPINTVLAEINFDPERAMVEDITMGESICHPDLVFEKIFDNQNGTVRVGCSIPTPGFRGRDAIIATLLIRPLSTGNIGFDFGYDSRVLANDGVGTDVLRSTTGAGFNVLDYRTVDNLDGLEDILLFSPSHPNSQRWYNKKTFFMYWPQVRGASYYYSIDTNPDSEVSLEQKLPLNYISAQLTGEGQYYVHVQAQLDDSTLSSAAHYPIKLDFTAPDKPLIKSNATELKVGDVLRLAIESQDHGSGLQRAYYYRVDDSILLPTGENINIYFVDPGRHRVVVRVFDNAGNYSENYLWVEVKNK